MFRTALLRSQLRTLATPAFRPIALPRAAAVSAIRPVSASLLVKSRSYADAAGLSKSDIEGRVMEVMKSFEKVDGGKVGVGCHKFSLCESADLSTILGIGAQFAWMPMLWSVRGLQWMGT